MRINHNIAALNTYRQLNTASTNQSKSMEKLSSGLRINKAGDDAAGLAISEKMRGQIRGLDMASKNSQDAISLIQTAEGALNETHDILQRMRELAVQASNDTNTTSDREEIQKEINQMTSEINRIGNTTEFNTQKLLNNDKNGAAVKAEYKLAAADITFATATTDKMTIGGKEYTASASDNGVAGLAKLVNADATNKYTATANADGTLTLTAKTAGVDTPAATDFKEGTTNVTPTTVTTGKAADATKSLKFQIGANESQSLTLDISDMRAVALGISSTGTSDAKLAVTDGTSNTTTEQALSVLTHADASATVTKIQSAIDKVSAERSKLGANQNRLEHTINNLSTSSENLTAAESRIRDVDMAKEMMNQTKNSILSQAAQAMLAQANQQPQGVLQLLR
ncbi:flagellin [Cytobacillus firmus]|uniref:flagellin N-terminal helical domain-containing protein n=1 Tax=Cytobacillus firmus TaxID=1399 RepID=UPI0021637865|nr:flagellin [Cytobacillus firmus]MCS0673402.1 flagellin [Cytobacillus firmus]